MQLPFGKDNNPIINYQLQFGLIKFNHIKLKRGEINMQNNNRHANFSTLFLAIFKEARLNLKLNQSVIASTLGKTPSAWTKVENGQSQISFDIFLGVCQAINLQPAYAISIVEKLTFFFNQRGYFFFYGSDDDDLLLPLILEFYNSKGFGNTQNFVSIFAFNNTNITPTIVRYCTESEFKKWFDNGAQEGSYELNNILGY